MRDIYTHHYIYIYIYIERERERERYLIRTYHIAHSTQYSVVVYMGKKAKKEWIYVYV